MAYFDDSHNGTEASRGHDGGAEDGPEPDQRFSVLNPNLRAQRQSALAPDRDGLLQRIEHQLGSVT